MDFVDEKDLAVKQKKKKITVKTDSDTEEINDLY